jgi:hypothetical protein
VYKHQVASGIMQPVMPGMPPQQVTYNPSQYVAQQNVATMQPYAPVVNQALVAGPVQSQNSTTQPVQVSMPQQQPTAAASNSSIQPTVTSQPNTQQQ